MADNNTKMCRRGIHKVSTARLIVADSANGADLRYASGFSAIDPVVCLVEKKRCFLVVPMLEVGRARLESPSSVILTPAELGVDPADRRSLGAWTRGLLRRVGVRSVQVSAFFPLSVARAIEEEGVSIDIAHQPLFPARAVKRDEEVANIARVQRAAVAAMREAIETIRVAHVGRRRELRWKGAVLSSEGVKRRIDRVLLDHGCRARETIVACGRHAADPHHRGEGPLRAHETIVIDIFPQDDETGYWGDLTRTIVKQEASPEVKRMVRAVRDAHAWALAAMRPGVRADCLHREVQRRMSEAGFVTETREGIPVGFFHGTGHGVGLDIHEGPTISAAPVRLKRGNVVTIEPGLYYPKWGGVRIEDTVVVERGGARVLCPCPYPFELP